MLLSHFETAWVGANIFFFRVTTAQGALQKPYSAASILFVACKEVALQASAMEMPHSLFNCFCILIFSSWQIKN
jgi:hypothetical protein